MIAYSNFPIIAEVGSEFISGSTRLKAGTSQKLILNMISTSLMIKMGHVKGNKMVDMQLTNKKLVARGAKMIAEQLNLDLEHAEKLLIKFGSVRNAIENFKQ
jgi:N-acetylmuramic acid 6-phosphate etherase